MAMETIFRETGGIPGRTANGGSRSMTAAWSTAAGETLNRSDWAEYARFRKLE